MLTFLLALAITITPAALPPATVGQPYAVTLQAADGAAPYLWFLYDYTWRVPGLTLNADGTITGTPTAAGVYGVQVRVLDSSGSPLDAGLIDGAQEAVQFLTLVVN